MYKVRRGVFQGRYIVEYYLNSDLLWSVLNIVWEDVMYYLKNSTEVVKYFEEETRS